MNTKPVLANEARLNKLKELLLLDSPAEEAFDRLTRLASKIVNAPVSLVSLVDVDRQFFKSFVGLPEPWASERETPLSHSFCQYVVATGEPLVVEDARKVDLLKDNLAIPDLDVIGYLGMPIMASDGSQLGSFCVIDSKPRQWTQREIEIVQELAISAMAEIELREQVIAREKIEKALEEHNRQLKRVTIFCRSTLMHMEDSLNHSASLEEMTLYVSQALAELDRLS